MIDRKKVATRAFLIIIATAGYSHHEYHQVPYHCKPVGQLLRTQEALDPFVHLDELRAKLVSFFQTNSWSFEPSNVSFVDLRECAVIVDHAVQFLGLQRVLAELSMFSVGQAAVFKDPEAGTNLSPEGILAADLIDFHLYHFVGSHFGNRLLEEGNSWECMLEYSIYIQDQIVYGRTVTVHATDFVHAFVWSLSQGRDLTFCESREMVISLANKRKEISTSCRPEKFSHGGGHGILHAMLETGEGRLPRRYSWSSVPCIRDIDFCPTSSSSYDEKISSGLYHSYATYIPLHEYGNREWPALCHGAHFPEVCFFYLVFCAP